jgi:molecular chaperone HscB
MQALQRNFFEFFSLPVSFELDRDALEQAYRTVQSSVHPDRFANAAPPEKRYAMQLATLANEAVQTLRDPLARARYLCELNNVDVGAEDNTAMPPEFMMQQMEWREALEEAVDGKNLDEVKQLSGQIDRAKVELQSQLSQALDSDRDYIGAADLVRRWMFIDRFEHEVKPAMRSLATGK